MNNHLYSYGADGAEIRSEIEKAPELGEKLHAAYDYTVAEVLWAVRKEMALEVEDVLARRVRLLFLDAQAAIEAAPKVAKIMAKELGHNQNWVNEQVVGFTKLAQRYLGSSCK